jgi:hypothetical protein
MTMTTTTGLPATTTIAAAGPGGPRIDTATITAGLATVLGSLAVTTGGHTALLVLAVVTALGLHHTRP